MDELDQRILEELERDARSSYVQIGLKVNLSEAAVRRRVQNLVQRGVIKRFTVEVDKTQGASAVTFVSVNPAVPTPEVSAKYRALKGVEVVYEITGEYDVAGVISGPNIAEINRTVDEIRRIEGVTNTNTLIILRTIR